MDYFEIFGLPRRLGLDEAALQQRFYALSRQHHPDFHHGADPEDAARVLNASALVNTAYRVLRDPIRRLEYLVRLEEGHRPGAGAPVKPVTPPDLLAEMFEMQEALQAAKAGGLDEAGRAELRSQRQALQAREGEEGARLRDVLARQWDEAPAPERPRVLAAIKEALATRAYLRTVIDDLAEALGEGQEPYVSHHRH
jgi:molecular chaperone HscB